MNIEALQQLRRVVEEAPEDLLHMRAVVEEASCGTARCAIGWCLIDPWFQKNTRISEYAPPDYHGPGLPEPTFVNLTDLFGISSRDADNLFGGDLGLYIDEHAVSKEEVLWNIDELLAGRHALPYEAVDDSSIPVYAMNIENPQYYGVDEVEEVEAEE